jgi:hypothetical protein
VLTAALTDERQKAAEGIEGFHRGYGGSPALHARLLRMWEEYEDRITAVLAAEAGSAESDRAESDRGESDRGESDRAESDRGESDRGESAWAAAPAMRLRAISLVGILRCLTSAEMRAAVAGRPPGDRLAYVCDWLHAAGESA